MWGRARPGGLLTRACLVLAYPTLLPVSARGGVARGSPFIISRLGGAAGPRPRAETGSQALIVLAAIALTATVLAFFAVDTLRNAPETFSAIVGIALLSVLLDFLWKRARNRGEGGGAAEPSTG